MKKLVLNFIFATLSIVSFSQPISWQARGIGGGGALFYPTINPFNTNEYFVACDMGEQFHTTNFGNSYTQLNSANINGNADAKVCFTSTPGLLYSLTILDPVAGNNVPVKSIDNGLTWVPFVLPVSASGENFVSIYSSTSDPDLVVFSNYGQVFVTHDGGATVDLEHTALDGGSGCILSGFFFDNTSNRVYIATNDGVLVSTNGGYTWAITPIGGLPINERIWSFAIAKVGSTTRFYCITGAAGNTYVGVKGLDYWGFTKGVYTVDYIHGGTNNWTSIATGIDITNGEYPMYIDCAENDINTVYVAGSSIKASGGSWGEPMVLKSVNAGSTWTNSLIVNNNQNVFTGWAGHLGDRQWSYGECALGFDVCATDANKVIITDFGFPHKTTNGGSSWSQGYVDVAEQNSMNAATPQFQSYKSIGLENTTCWQVTWANATNLWASYSDVRGMRSTDAGNKWSFNYTGHLANTAYRTVKTSSGTLIAATSNVHDMYQSTRLKDIPLDNADPNGKLIYSTNNGQTWNLLKLFGHPVYWIALDPNNTNRAYASVIHYAAGAGVGGVYRCDDLSNLATSTWTLLADPPRTQKHPASLEVLNDGTVVAAFSGRRNTSGVPVFASSSGVFTYNPTTNTWADVSDPVNMIYWTKEVVIDPNDATQNTWYACVASGWGGAPAGTGGLYKTINRGSTWIRLTDPIIDRVESCTFNPTNPNELYFTTEGLGLWMSSNINARGTAAPSFTRVLGYEFKNPLKVFFNPFDTDKMWVTSFGNGMKIGSLSTVLPVKFESFTAICNNQYAQLNWKTTSEINNDYFEVEKSEDGNIWKKIGKVFSANKTYTFNDNEKLNGLSFYRIKQTDKDGSFYFSKIISLNNCETKNNNYFTITPAFAQNSIKININTFANNSAFKIVNENGKTVYQFTSNNSKVIDISNLAKGIYFVIMINNENKMVQKFVKQ
ncbi:MAG: T9SS type A sorting domain-containing protein [Ferruginibacter sp.]|nr:T9SS type A sorting domain-containing protein [Ferruginibacter sp.]